MDGIWLRHEWVKNRWKTFHEVVDNKITLVAWRGAI